MWGLMPGQALDSKTWDGAEYVLYNDLSGDTHLLGADALALLWSLRQGDADAQALSATLTAARGDADGAVAPADVLQLLEQLAKLSLVERRPC